MKYFSTVLTLVLLLLGSFPGPSGSAEETSDSTREIECEDKGGKWETPKTSAAGQCNLPTLDAGKICNDSAECESACIAGGSMLPGIQTSGICYGWSLLEAECVNPISSGVTQGSTCDD